MNRDHFNLLKYYVKNSTDGYFITKNFAFSTISSLLEHYKKYPISPDISSLKLTHPLASLNGKYEAE